MKAQSDSRQRAQIVIALGRGNLGFERKKQFEKAASRLGQTLSEWGRVVLCAAAGMPGEELVTRAEYQALVERMERMEKGLR